MADYDLDGAAELLNLSRWYLKRHIKELPHHRYGPKLIRFTDEDLDAIREMTKQRPDEPKPSQSSTLQPTTTRRRRAS